MLMVTRILTESSVKKISFTEVSYSPIR